MQLTERRGTSAVCAWRALFEPCLLNYFAPLLVANSSGLHMKVSEPIIKHCPPFHLAKLDCNIFMKKSFLNATVQLVFGLFLPKHNIVLGLNRYF